MNERHVLKWLAEARTQPPNWEMYTKVQAYVIDKAKALGMKFQSTTVDVNGLKPTGEQEVYAVMLEQLEWLWDSVWERIREEQGAHPKRARTQT